MPLEEIEGKEYIHHKIITQFFFAYLLICIAVKPLITAMKTFSIFP